MLLLYLALDLLVLLNDELKVSSRASISTRAEHPLMLCRSTSAAWRRIQSQSALLQYLREPN